jgi:hypothetical protein
MALTIPPFSQFQAPTPILRGLWRHPPKEGDRFINAEIDWGSLPASGNTCVQFALSGNSPVALSQIVALSVDNSRCGSDVQFVFPDSGFILTVPAHEQGVYPVFTNALTFYAIYALGLNPAPFAPAVADRTILQVLNSMPPPVAVPPSALQTQLGQGAIGIAAGTTAIITPANGPSGTLTSIQGQISCVQGASAGVGTFSLFDNGGIGKLIWSVTVNAPANVTTIIPINVTGINQHFINGVYLVQSTISITGGIVSLNLYYTTP